jgi:hypothetical protein
MYFQLNQVVQNKNTKTNQEEYTNGEKKLSWVSFAKDKKRKNY